MNANTFITYAQSNQGAAIPKDRARRVLRDFTRKFPEVKALHVTLRAQGDK